MKSPSQNFWVGLSFLALGLIIGLFFSNLDTQSGQIFVNGSGADVDSAVSQPAQVVSISKDDDPGMGDPNAPIVMIEFSNFQCGFCRKFHAETLPKLKEKYIDEGLVYFVYRDYAPEVRYPQARITAEAAECVDQLSDDETYFAMNDLIFDNSALWSGNSEAESVLVNLASTLNVDIASCLANNETQAEVESDYLAGRSYGIEGTPTFFINGKALVGAQDWELFDAVLESELESLGY